MPKSLFASSSTIQTLLAGTKYISFHTNDPTTTGNQSTNEVSYTNYVRMPVDFDFVNNEAIIPDTIIWPTAGSAATVRYIGIGNSLTEAEDLLYYAELPNAYGIVLGTVPRITELIIREI